jgi:hypothetical protein
MMLVHLVVVAEVAVVAVADVGVAVAVVVDQLMLKSTVDLTVILALALRVISAPGDKAEEEETGAKTPPMSLLWLLLRLRRPRTLLSRRLPLLPTKRMRLLLSLSLDWMTTASCRPRRSLKTTTVKPVKSRLTRPSGRLAKLSRRRRRLLLLRRRQRRRRPKLLARLPRK